jgi:molecular chaperone GrpE
MQPFDTQLFHLYNAFTMVEKDNIYDEEEIIADTEIPDDDIELEAEEGALKDKVSVLRAKLKACEEQKQAHSDELQRARADFLNSRRRLEEQFARDKERAGDKILKELLTLADSFDTAMADKEVWGSVDERWRVGVEAIHSKLLSVLGAHDVKAIHPLHEQFNPERHEAVSNLPVEDDAEVEKILAVLQKGYERGDTIIRPARVVVGTK